MNILIIGGTGFISTKLVEKLLQSGNKVIVGNRGKSKRRINGNENLIYETVNRSNENRLREILNSYKIDVVYDMIAYHPEQSEIMVKIFKGRVHRFIHCSTVSVYMVSDEVQSPVTEDQDKRKLMDYNERNPFGMSYGINKRKCEDVLWSAHGKDFPVSMLRPTFVCGPHDPTGRDWFWIERILDEKPLLVPGTGEYKFQLVYVDDTAQAFHDLIYNDKSIGEAYNVAADEIITLKYYLKLLSKILNKNPEMIFLKEEKFDTLPFSRYPGADVFPFNTRRNAYFSLDKIKRDLNYKSTPIETWMRETVNWHLKNVNEHSAGYEFRNDELKVINFITRH